MGKAVIESMRILGRLRASLIPVGKCTDCFWRDVIILDAATGQIKLRGEAPQVPTHQQSIEEISRFSSDALIHNQALAIGQRQFGTG
jgi:hypothetical protein